MSGELKQTLMSTWRWWAPPLVLMCLVVLVVMLWLGGVRVPGAGYAVF